MALDDAPGETAWRHDFAIIHDCRHFIVSLTFQEILCMNSYPLINNYLYRVVGDSFCDL